MRAVMSSLFILFYITIFIYGVNAKCGWQGGAKSWHQSADGRWVEYEGDSYKKTFNYQHTVYPGDKVTIIQQSGLAPLILDETSAYYDGTKFASGGWLSSWYWKGQDNHDDVQFIHSGNTWEEYRRAFLSWDRLWFGMPRFRHVKTFQHIQIIEPSTIAVILQQPSLWAFVLTDDHIYYKGVESLAGEWISECNWKGVRADHRTSSEFKRVSPRLWKEYSNSRYLKTFSHIQNIDKGSNAVVIQQSRLKPLVIDKSAAYYNNVKFADGRWISSSEWRGTRTEAGRSAKFVRSGSRWTEYKAGNVIKTFSHVQTISNERSAVILQQNCLWPLILDDDTASYNGRSFANGYWGAADELPNCSAEDESSSINTHDELRKKRSINLFTDSLLCQVRTDLGNRLNVTLRGHDSDGRLIEPATRRIQRLSVEAISLLHAGDISREGSTVVTVGGNTGVRIDIQGGFTRDGIRYSNIQVQTNGHGSRSVAQANVPQSGNLIREIRRALYYSLEHSYIVTIQNERW